MRNFFIYPLNVVVVLLIALLFALLNLSFFYKEMDLYDILIIIFFIILYGVQYSFLKRVTFRGYVDFNNAGFYKKYLLIGVVGFVVEFFIYGVPFFSQNGRDDFEGLPVLHVFFYSCIIMSVLFSSLYSHKKSLILCLLATFVISVLLVSRQMMMFSFVIVIVSILMRYKLKKRIYIKFIFYSILILMFFGILGNIRQTLSGDYIPDYIIVVGGANENGEILGDVLYWTWLYVASPLYNLLVNLNSYYLFGEKCNTAVYYGTCHANFITSVFIPETIVKYLGLEHFKIDLQVAHLNVGTGFAPAARILGVVGVVIQIILQGFFFFLGWLLTPSKLKSAFVVYYSVLAFFMIFDNLFLKGEFFLGFVIIFLSRYKFVFNKP